MYSTLLKRYCWTIPVFTLLILIIACSNTPTNTSNPTNISEIIIGRWNFVGIGEMSVNGTPIPSSDPKTIKVNSDITSQANAEYQFYSDGTVVWRLDSKAKAQPGTMHETGTYKISADGHTLDIHMAATWLIGLIGRPIDANIAEFTMSIQNNKLTLRYFEKPGSSTNYFDFNFEKVQ